MSWPGARKATKRRPPDTTLGEANAHNFYASIMQHLLADVTPQVQAVFPQPVGDMLMTRSGPIVSFAAARRELVA